MTYELAKQLKDAGFPQEGVGGWSITVNEINVLTQNGDDIEEYKRSNCYYYPTLSELLEACGDKFYSLQRRRDINGVVKWQTPDGYFDTRWITGDTPEEAVAKLWLALSED